MKDIKKLFIGLFIFTLLIINFLAVAQESVDEEFTEQLESTPPTLKERFLAIEREKEELLFKSKKFPLPNDNHLALLDSQESIDEKEVSEAPLTLKEITLVDKYNFSEATSEAEESLDLNSFPLPNDNHLATSDFQEDIALNINAILNTNTDKKEELLFKYYVVEAIESYQEVNEALGLNHDNSIYIAVPAVPVLLYATHKAVQLGEGAVRSITPDRMPLMENLKKARSNFYKAQSDYRESSDNLKKARSNHDKVGSDLNKAQSDYRESSDNLHKVESDLEKIRSDLEKIRSDFRESTANPDKTRSDFDKAVLNLKKAQSNLYELESDLKKAQSNFQKIQSNISEIRSDFDKAVLNLKKAQSNLYELESDLKKAQSNFQKIQSDFDKARSNRDKVASNFEKAKSNLNKERSNFNKTRTQLENQRFRFNSLYKAGRLLRGAGFGVIAIAGVSAYAVIAGDLVYITFDTFSDMDVLKDRYNSDIQDIVSS